MNDEELIFEQYLIIKESSELFGPVYHRTISDINKLSDYDIYKSQKGTVLGPAIYATYGESTWTPSHLRGGKILKGYVKGEIIDLTKPLEQRDKTKIEGVLGRTIDTIPLITLERRFGSIANGLKEIGYAGAIHQGPGSSGKHIAIFSTNDIIDIED